MGIKWKILCYLSVFVLIMLALLWTFQIAFLNDFYRAIKTNSIRSTAQLVEKHLKDEGSTDQLENIATKKDIFIRLIDSDGTDLFSFSDGPGKNLKKLPEEEIEDLQQKTVQNGGSLLQVYNHKKWNKDSDASQQNDRPKPEDWVNQFILYTSNVTLKDGNTVFLLIGTMISPVDATVETLRTQLIWITLIMLLLCALLAILISRNISKPIVQINRSAKELAHGNYHVHFEEAGYREVAELGATLNYAAKELSTVESLRKELIANVSHDLRTPLTMITAYSEIMRDLPGENTAENVQVIIDETTRLTALVNDMLDLSKIQAGSDNLSMEEFNLTESINTILMRYAKLIENDGYHIDFDYEEDVFVEADEMKMSQVIYNLINNAINYTGENKQVSIRQTVKNGSVTISITDTGKGIAQEELPYIWERYYKVDKAHKRSTVGTGLGLSIVKGILEMHHAEYGVISEIGKGSTFYFTLPCK